MFSAQNEEAREEKASSQKDFLFSSQKNYELLTEITIKMPTSESPCSMFSIAGKLYREGRELLRRMKQKYGKEGGR